MDKYNKTRRGRGKMTISSAVIQQRGVEERQKQYYDNLTEDQRAFYKKRAQESYNAAKRREEEMKASSKREKEGVFGFIGNITDQVSKTNLEDFVDAGKLWIETLNRLDTDADKADIYNQGINKDDVKRISEYKYWQLQKRDIENALNNPQQQLNSNQLGYLTNRLDAANEKIAELDHYFKNEGRKNVAVRNYMFDADNLDLIDKARLHWEYTSRNYENTDDVIKNDPWSSWYKAPLTAASNLIGLAFGHTEGLMTSNRQKLTRVISNLDENDPIFQKAYKGSLQNVEHITHTINDELFGVTSSDGEVYEPGLYYNDYQRAQNKAIAQLKEHEELLKDGKINPFGFFDDGISVFGDGDVNPQFRKEHEEYGNGENALESIVSGVTHPLHGFVETASTVGMMKYQLPAYAADGASFLLAKTVPAIAVHSTPLGKAAQITATGLQVVAPALSLKGAVESRQEETKVEMIGAVAERVMDQVRGSISPQDFPKMFNQIASQAESAGLDINQIVNKTTINGKTEYTPKDQKSIQEMIKLGVAFNFATSFPQFEQAKLDARRGVNKLINANNALAMSDYLQAIPFLSFQGRAVKSMLARDVSKELQQTAAADFAKRTMSSSAEKRLFGFIDGGNKSMTFAQKQLASGNTPGVRGIVDLAVDKATKKMIQNDVSKGLIVRDVARYIASKADLLLAQSTLEGIEEINQYMLQTKYKKGEFDDYNKDVSLLNVNEVIENIGLSINGLGNFFGLRTDFSEDEEQELRKSGVIGFASSFLFSNAAHAKGNIYNASDDNLVSVFKQIGQDRTIGKIFAEQQEAVQDLTHLGMYYDSMKNGGKSAEYLIERLQYLKDNLDTENSLVTEGFVDADMKLVRALNASMNNPELSKIVKQVIKDDDLVDNEMTEEQLAKRMAIQSAKDIVDANSGEELLQIFANGAQDKHRIVIRELDKMFNPYGVIDAELYEEFKQQHPRLAQTIDNIWNQYQKYKEHSKNRFESERSASGLESEFDFFEQYRKKLLSGFEEDYDENLGISRSFVQNQDVLRMASERVSENKALSIERALRDMYDNDLEEIVFRLSNEYKNGLNFRDFAVSRLNLHYLYKRLQAAKAVANLTKNNSEIQQRVQDVTGLDIDIETVNGITKSAQRIADTIQQSVDDTSGATQIRNENERRKKSGEPLLEEINIENIVGDFILDEEFDASDFIMSASITDALLHPLRVRRNAYTLGSVNPVSLRDAVYGESSETDNLLLNDVVKRFQESSDRLRTEDILGMSIKEREQLTTTQRNAYRDAAIAFMLKEATDMKNRLYIANRRKQKDTPITHHDIERAQNGDVGAQQRLTDYVAERTGESVSIDPQQGEQALRVDLGMGRRKTKSDKEKEIEKKIAEINRNKSSEGVEIESDEVILRDDEVETDSETDRSASTTIPVEYTSRAGNTANGKYIVDQDDDGYVHVNYEGHVPAKRNFTKDAIESAGLTVDDIIGSKDEYNTPENYDEALEALEDAPISIDSIHIRPNGVVSVITPLTEFELDGEKADLFLDAFFPELKPYRNTTPSKPSSTEDPLLTPDVDAAEEERGVESEGLRFEDDNGGDYEPQPQDNDYSIDELDSVNQRPGEIEQGPVDEDKDDADSRISDFDQSTEYAPLYTDSDIGIYKIEDSNRLDDEISITDRDGNAVSEDDRKAVEEDIEGLLKSEDADFSQDNLVDMNNVNTENATNETIGGLINQTVFYDPQATTPPFLRVNGKDIKLPKELGTGKELSKKLLQKGWLTKAKKYYIVTQSEVANRMKNVQDRVDTLTVALIIEDEEKCYATFYRPLGELYSKKVGEETKIFHKNLTQKLEDELYSRYVDWDKVLKLAVANDLLSRDDFQGFPESEPSDSQVKAKWMKKVAGVRAKQIAMGLYNGRYGNVERFEEWWKDSNQIKLSAEDEQIRSKIISDSWQIARKQITKFGKNPISQENIDAQIEELRKNREDVIYAYLNPTVKIERGKETLIFDFPEDVRTDIQPDIVEQSNGKINNTVDEDTGLHIFHNVAGNASIPEITQQIETGTLYFGFGTGAFSEEKFNIVEMFKPYGQREVIKNKHGYSVGKGLSGKVYMIIKSITGRKVPIQLRESRFNVQIVGGKKVLLNDDSAWNNDSKTDRKFVECFRINDRMMPELDTSVDARPSVAEVLFYMVCGKLMSGSEKMDAEFFIHNGKRTLITNTEKAKNANAWFGPKQLYWGAVENGVPMDISDQDLEQLDRSKLGLIIGLPDNSGVYRQTVFMHDELFGPTQEAFQNRRTVIRAIATQMHWSTDALLFQSTSSVGDFGGSFGSIVAEALRQNPGKEECSLFGCPELTFNRSDFEKKDRSGVLTPTQVQYAAWCLNTGKLQTDVDLQNPFVAPFVFSKGVKEQSITKADKAAAKLGVKENDPKSILDEPQQVSLTRDDVMWGNVKNFDEDVWKRGSRKRDTVLNKVLDANKKSNRRQEILDVINKTEGAKGNPYVEAVAFKFKKDSDKTEVRDHLKKQIKQFVRDYNSVKENKVKIKLTDKEVDSLVDNIAQLRLNEFVTKTHLPVLFIHEDGKADLTFREFKATAFNNPASGITGIYSQVRGKGKVDIQSARSWLEKKLGIQQHQIIVTDAIMKGVNDEKVFGLVDLASDSVRYGLIKDDPFVMLSKQGGIGLEYHEGWHYVNLLVHNKAAREAVYQAYVQSHKHVIKDGKKIKIEDALYEDIEEALAEEFRSYILTQETSGIKGKILRAYDRIMDFLFYTADKKAYREVFKEIQSGKYETAKLDKESVKQFHDRYDKYKGARSTEGKNVDIYTADVESMPGIDSKNDLIETLDGCINAVQYELNFDSVDKVKNYNKETDFKAVIQIIEDLANRQTDPALSAKLKTMLDNPHLIEKALQDYFLSLDIKFKVKHNKKSKDAEKIDLGQDDKDAALEKEDDPDNSYDKVSVATSHKDNAAFRAKMFLRRVPKYRKVLISETEYEYENQLDKFGTPEFWSYDEVWNLVLNNLWKCNTLDKKDEDGNYVKKSIRGEIKRLAKSNVMFQALDDKFDDIEDDENLRSQIFTTISSSKNPVMLAMIQNVVKRKIEFYGDDTYDASADENFDATDTKDNKQEADRERTWKWTNDDSLQVAFSVPRQWSQNITLRGFLKYNKTTGKNQIDKIYASTLNNKFAELRQLLQKYKSKKRSSGKLQDPVELYNVLYGIDGIRAKAIDVCEFLGIPLDQDVLDQYISMFDGNNSDNDESSDFSELQKQIDTLNGHLFSNVKGSIGNIVTMIVNASNQKNVNSIGNREFDQVFNNYSIKSDIGKLAVAYNDIHPDLREYAVRDANGNMMYPINLPNELSDKTQRLQDPNSEESAKNMMLSSYCEHSVILSAANQASSSNPSEELRLNTFAGLKDNNTQNGSDHAGLTALEDLLCKMFLTEQDHIVFPTMADKPTWQSLESSKIKLSHDLILCSSFYDDIVDIIEEEGLSGIEYNESKGRARYYSDLYEWYLNLDPESEIKKNIDKKAFGEGINMYRRFSDQTLQRFSLFYLDEINSLRDYYKREHVKELVNDPNIRIANISGGVVNGRLTFNGNGGKFRYFYDVQIEDGMNLNQKLQFLFNLQKQIEAGNVYDNNDNSVTRKITIEKLTGVKKENCDGFELIRMFLDQLHGQVLSEGRITADTYDKINRTLIDVVDRTIENLSSTGDPLQLVVKDSETGLYSPTRIPKQLLTPYLKKLQDLGMVKGAAIYSKAKNEKNKYAEQQATYSLLANHTINTILSIMEVEKVYSGDPAQYKYKTNPNNPTTTVTVEDYQIGGHTISFETEVDNVYDKFSDKIKRLGGTQSPGNKLRLDWSEDELSEDPELASQHYTVCEVEDIEVPSAHLDVVESIFRTQLLVDYVRNNEIPEFEEYVDKKIKEREQQNKNLKASGKKEKRSLNKERIIDLIYHNETVKNEVLDLIGVDGKSFITETLYSQIGPYTNITVTDAQVFIRPQLYRKIRMALGEWSVIPDASGYSDEIAYQICEKDDSWMSDPEKYILVKKFQLNALKMSYFQNSPAINGGMNINKAIYDKMAIFPLFKFHRSSQVGRMLYDRMNAEDNELDMIAFKSAVKVGPVQSSISPASIDGVSKYVKQTYGKDFKKLDKESQIAYQVEYSKTQAVKEATSKLDERFGGSVVDGKFVPKLRSTSRVDYTETQNDIKTDTDTSTPHLYTSVQNLKNIRLQLNTKAHDAIDRSIGTQMFKIAFSNIIDDAEYGQGKSGQTSRTGAQIKEDIMKRILQLTNLGIDEIRKRFYTDDGQIDRREVQRYIETVCINNSVGEASMNLLKNGATAASLMSRSVFEHGVSKLVNSEVVDISTKGGTAIQQSMFGFSSYGSSTVATQYGEGLGDNDKYQVYNGGEELNWNAKEGTMEVLLSLNFFKAVVPKEYQKTPEMMRQWLIDHDVIKGVKSKEYWQVSEEDSSITTPVYSNPKPFGIGYRIPTQGMSSMFSYIVADVLPEQCGDLIVVPREFTAQTGSDFDVDKIYLANFSYTKDGVLEKEQPGEPLTKGMVTNALLQDYIDIISDKKNFSDARASIDVITKKIQNELLDPILREKTTGYIPGMYELTPDFQAKTKMEFGAGKSGIGPFALNITNLALTQFAHLTMDFGDVGQIFDLGPLDAIYGKDNLRISAWLSAMVNAHVDVAKDPYVFALNVNKFTYNHANLLLRCGKGINTFVFLAQPGLKRYANTVNNTGGVYGNNIDGNQNTNTSRSKNQQYIKKSIIRKYSNAIKFRLKNGGIVDKEQIKYLEQVVDYCEYMYPLSKQEIAAANAIRSSGNKKNIPTRPFDFKNVFDFQTAANAIQTLRTSSDNTKLALAEAFQIEAIEAYEQLEPYSQALGELVQCSQIDTKKFGNNVASQINFKNKIESMLNESTVWTINEDGFVDSVPIREGEKTQKQQDVSYMALMKYFNTTYLDKKFRSARAYTKVLLQHQMFTGTDLYEEVFKFTCSVLNGSTDYEAIDGKRYHVYGKIYKDDAVQAIAGVIDDIMRYSTFMNSGPKIIEDVLQRNEDALDFTSASVPQTMKRLIFGDDKHKSIFERLTVLIRNIKDDPDSYDELVDSEGNINNKFLLFLNPQLPSNKFPIGRLLLTQPQTMLSSPVKIQLQFGFDQLLRSSNDEIRQLANDLAYYAYFSTYDQNTSNSFFDLVPPEFRKQYDVALKRTLSNHRSLSAYQNVTGHDYDRDAKDIDSKKAMVVKFVNDLVDIMSRNYWFNDNIVPRFFPVAKNTNDFSIKHGSVLANGVYDSESGRSFSPWIATTERNSLYFKVQKGPTTMLYRKVGTVTKKETVQQKGKPVTYEKVFSVYAVAQKAGIHKGKINQFELYCNKNTPSIFEQNKIGGPQFAFDNIRKDIQERVNKYKAPEGKDISISFEWGDDISIDDSMYQSTNYDVYEKSKTVSLGTFSEERTSYAIVRKATTSSFKSVIDDSDFVINLVNKVFANLEDNKIGVPALLERKDDIFDHSLSNSTEKLVSAIIATGKESVSIGVVNNYQKDKGYFISQERIDKRKKQLVQQFELEYNGDQDVDIAAQAYEKSLNDFDIKDQLLEQDVYEFLSSLVTNLTAKGIQIKQINVPVAANKAYARAATRIHKDYDNVFEEKASVYPSISFANKTFVYRSFVASLSELCDDQVAAEDQTDAAEELKDVIEEVVQKEDAAASKAKSKFGNNMAHDDILEQSLKEDDVATEQEQEPKPKKNKFGSNMAQDDDMSITSEVDKNKNKSHEEC